MALSFFLLLILIYGAIIAYMALFQRSMVFHPNTNNVFADELLQNYAPFELVTTTTQDGLTLKGLYVPPQQDKAVIVYFHGNAGADTDRLYKTTSALAAGYGFLLTEYRGYGGNPGLPTEQGLYQDARAWLSFLHQRHITSANMIYYGESMGTGVAVQMAVEQPAKALILEAPFTSITDVAAFYYPYLPVRLLLQHKFESLRKVNALTTPVLIYHGTLDRTVPYRFGQQLFAALPGQDNLFVTIKNGQHADLYALGADIPVMEFIKKHAP